MITLKFELNTQYQIEIINPLANDIDSMYPTDWCEIFLFDTKLNEKLCFVKTTIKEILLDLGCTISKIIEGKRQLDTFLPFTIGEKYNSLDLEQIEDDFDGIYELKNILFHKYGLIEGNSYHTWLYSKDSQIYFELLELVKPIDEIPKTNKIVTPCHIKIKSENLLNLMKYFNFYYMKINDDDIEFPEYGLPTQEQITIIISQNFNSSPNKYQTGLRMS
jgi:hypothetical protein